MKPNDSIRILNPQAKNNYNYINNAIRTCSNSNINNTNNNDNDNTNSNNNTNTPDSDNDNKTTTTTTTTGNIISNKTGKLSTIKSKSMKMSSSTTTTTQNPIKDTTATTTTKTTGTTINQNNDTENLITKISENPEITEIPSNVKEALNKLVRNKFSKNLIKFETIPVSARGENSYGSVLQFKVYLDNNNEEQQQQQQQEDQQQQQQEENLINNNDNNNKDNKDNNQNLFYCVAKISPKNEARRQTMKVVDYYKREIYLYNNVLNEYEKLQMSSDNKLYNNINDNNIKYIKNLNINNNDNYNDNDPNNIIISMMMSAPKLYASSLEAPNEFLLLEDLQHSGYKRYNRNEPLTYEHTVLAIKELAKYHAMSYILKIKNPNKFIDIIDNIRNDNLFTNELSQVSVEFGKKYMKEAIKMLENDNNQKTIRLPRHKEKIINSVTKLYDNFRDICNRLVNGEIVEPYSVICHGDFWNNNILYKYDNENLPISAKVIDYQMARYASPVLDLVHYLFTCTGKELRDRYFDNFKDNYYNQLANTLRNFDLDPNEIFPRLVFENQINQYGIYGFCMACYALPFFISDSSELPNLDKAAEAMREVSESSSDDGESEEDKNLKRKTTALLEEYEMLNDRTKPIFRERMIGVLVDLGKYNLLDSVFLKE